MAFDTSRLRFGDMIAGASALALFIFMLFPWYKGSFEGFGQSESESENAWSALGFGKIFLLLLILVVIGAVVVRAIGAEAQLPVPLGVVMMGAGVLAALYILFRIIDLPGEIGEAADALDALPGNAGVDFDIGRSFGIFLAFIAALGMAAGGFLSTRERGEAIPGVGGPLGGAPAGGDPLGTGQPAGYGGQPAGGQPVGGQPVGGQPVGGQPVGGQPVGGGPAAGAGVGAASAGVADPGAGAQTASAGNPAPDWYEDPRGEARLRYWDGQQWTDQTAD